MSLAERERVMQEIREVIAFYSERGWDWLDAVGFTYWKARQR